MPSSFEVHSYMHKTFKHIFPKIFQDYICVPHGVSAHSVTMESKERKAIQCLRPGLLTRGDLLEQHNASLHTAHTTALLYTRYWEHVPVQPHISPLRLSSIWKMAENYFLGQQFRSDTIRDEIQKEVWEQAQKILSHAIASAWTSLVTLWTSKGLVPTHNHVL